MTTLKDFLPKNFLEGQTNLTAIIEAISLGDKYVIDNLTSARRQFFLTSAEGRYLTSLANQYGFAVRPNSGLDQTGFRRLAQPAIWAPKQSIPTINKIAELFYSTAILHPSVTSTLVEPFSLKDGDNLFFETEDTEIPILFSAGLFADISNISASEIASTINNQARGLLFADTVLDRDTGLNSVRVVSLNFGAAARIRCSGGTAQNLIRFQEIKDATGFAGTNWLITKEGGVPYSSVVRFTWDGVGDNPQLYNLDIGDTVSIRDFEDDNTTNFSLLNGSYDILDVGADFFEIRSTTFQYTGVSYAQVSGVELCFTSRQARTLFDNEQFAIVSETSPGVLDISVPAVPPIVRRQVTGATRLRGEVLSLVRFEQSQIVVSYPNLLPDSGTVIIRTKRFEQGFNYRYYKYSSKLPPVGTEQSLNIESGFFNDVPFLSGSEADIGLSVIVNRNPILGSVGSPDIEVQTPGVKHFFENAQEITIEDASIDIDIFKYKVVPAIYCPPGQDYVVFEHDMDSDLLYIQFMAEDTKETQYLVYLPDTGSDPLNRTRVLYLPELEGRFLKATIVKMSDGIVPGDPTATLGPYPTLIGDHTQAIPFNFGTTFASFLPIDASVKNNLTGIRVVDNPNVAQFTYVGPSGVSDFLAMGVNFQQVFPGLVRAIAFNFSLPASPLVEGSRTLVHNLFSTSLIVEARVNNPGSTGLTPNSFVNFIKFVYTNDTEFEVKYNGLAEDITVDLFIIAAYFNPLESVHGGILRSDLNSPHIVRRRVDGDTYQFRIHGTGEAEPGLGSLSTSGKNVYGIGTSFTTEVASGDFISLPNGQKREVDFVINDTNLRLNQPFSPSIAVPTIYKVVSPDHNGAPFGSPVEYEGAVVFGFNVTYDPDPSRGTDIRFEFPDRVSRQNAGFIEGTSVVLAEGQGFDLQVAVASYIRGIELTVHSQDTQYVFFNAGIGAVPGNIIQGAKCYRSGYFGGSSFKHFLAQPLSQNNLEGWFKDAQVLLVDTNEPPNEFYVGSYIYDVAGTEAPFTVGNTSTFLVDGVSRLSAPGAINVGSAVEFPESGYIFIDFGNTQFEGPIRYRYRVLGAPDQLILDPAYVFKNDHGDNAIVRIAASTNKVSLKTDGSQYPAYLTGAVEARKTLEDILRELVSVGVKLNLEVQLPDLRFSEPSLQPFL